ncbi:hypothetical protein PsYK624_101240 [Phanerochaete sordida]|uniref:DUF6534 domain-containing protein n=1 Tax=Phanerochaete sordida TaxID=48140 RepID=A0A9P3LGM5_9APHY|nr:hypothetical protein PsYK624_101240 [Phanerochaete sordida]
MGLVPRFDVNGTLGWLLIAEIVISVLFGVATMQTYIYFYRGSRDGPFLRRTIFFLWVLDGVHLGFYSHAVYGYAVTNFMNPLALLNIPWSFAATMFITEMIQAIVTLIFSYRIYKLSERAWPLAFILPPQFLSCVGSIVTGVLECLIPSYQEFEQKYAWVWYSTSGLYTFVDCAIAVSLCVTLAKHRTSFRRTLSVVRTIILFSVCTCALTSSFALAAVITLVALPKSFLYVAFAIIHPNVMINSLLAMLNSRDMLREMYAGQVVSVHFSELTGGASADGARVAHAQGVGQVGAESKEQVVSRRSENSA